MNTLYLLISTLFNIYIMIVLMRIWLQWARADFYNPLSQFCVKVTSPILKPMRRFIPSIGSLDTASLVLTLILMVLKLTLLQTLAGHMSITNILPYLVWGALAVVKQAGYLVFWMLIIRAILSWVSQGQNPIEHVIIQLTEPLMSPIRRKIPPIGGLDLSIMIILLAMSLINSFMYEWQFLNLLMYKWGGLAWAIL